MVIDTSALVAIFLNEPERDQFLETIVHAEKRLISAASVVEAGIVLEARRGEAAAREFDLFLHQADIEVVSVTKRKQNKRAHLSAATVKDATQRH